MGKCSPCLRRIERKCCKHKISTSKFKNRSGTKEYKIFHNVNCKSKNVIYLVQCRKCKNKHFVGKCEEQKMQKRINTHRNDAKNPDSIPVDRHFSLPGDHFDSDFKLTITEEVGKPHMTNS